MSKREAEKQLTKNDSAFSGNSEQDIIDYAKQAPKEILLQRKIAVPQSRKKKYKELPTHSNPFANLSGLNGTQVSTLPIQPSTSSSFVPLFQQEKERVPLESLDSTHSNPSSSLLSISEIRNEYELLLHQRSVNYFFHKAINTSINEDPFGDFTKICYEYINYREKIEKSKESNNYTHFENKEHISSDKSSENIFSQQSYSLVPHTSNSNNTSTFVHPKSSFDYENETKNSPFLFPKKHDDKNMDKNDNLQSNKPPLSSFVTPTIKNSQNIQSAFEFQAADTKNALKTGFSFKNINNFNTSTEKKVQDQLNEQQSKSEAKTMSTMSSATTTGFSAFSSAFEANNSVNKNISDSTNFSFVPKINEIEQNSSFEIKKPSIETNTKTVIEEKDNKNLFNFTSVPKTETNTKTVIEEKDNKNLFNFTSVPKTETNIKTAIEEKDSKNLFNFTSVPKTETNTNTSTASLFNFEPTTSKNSNSDFSWTPDKGIKFAPSPSKDAGNPVGKAPTFQFVNPLSTGNIGNEVPQYKPVESVGFEFGNKINTNFSFGQPSAFSSSFMNFEQKNIPVAESTENDMFPQEPRTNDHLIAAKGEGEENEDIIFTAKAKIYKYSVKENRFSDLGIGILKLNVDKDTSKARVLARLEGSGKVIINAGLQKDFQYLITGKKSVKIPAIPRDGTGIDTYLVRVRDEETSKKLADLLESKKLGKQ
ncbi:hypothetical protein PORY_000653 [Pneumocystis oryctolagi]|uniref:Uncharacterized protein n=1 Tax=Pneumocystis oryctolagi TaxID=42067 RepID=A0ACB7CDS9_9ASCO|nr:hypothetical protein PORY_000653 [Pneumocystis oryctolagi]